MGTVKTLLVVGNEVWVSDEKESWALGKVTATDDESLTVTLNNGRSLDFTERKVKFEECHRANPKFHGGVEDMTKLSFLHEPGVLHNIDVRYELDEIYTYTGSILIAVNPFRKLPHLYGPHMMDQYKSVQLGQLTPHVFAVADSSFRAMVREEKSQSILVSGESGAGKTETTKLIMQYLAYVGGRKTDGRSVEQQVLESNPLLEAFGNAKTSRNDNSSRFGKYVEIQFDPSGRISGAAIRTYLLERSRIVQISAPERNFHIFYQLCAGASPEMVEHLHIKPASEFNYLNQSNCYDLDGVDNAEEFGRTQRAMGIVGISEEDQAQVWRTLAVVLHLGNCKFTGGIEEAKFADEESEESARTVAELLNVDLQLLHKALLTRTIVTIEQTFVRPMDEAGAIAGRDSLAKTLYSRVFDWLVGAINSSIGQDPDAKYSIGVLDIYGFESFKSNSFEQFCINLANEKLQQHFNQHVFKMEQEEYEREKIDWSYIDFVDNQDVLQLIEGKVNGILAVLDEQCKFPNADYKNFSTKLAQQHKDHKRFSVPRRCETEFILDHYAGKVCYDTLYFLDKNKDFVVQSHQNLLESSSSEFLKFLFPKNEEDTHSSMKFSSVGSRFKLQLAELMKALNTTEPHYVRCIKPNSFNKPSVFEKANVLHQLRCGGVLEAVRISCAGYPSRKTVEEFVDRFGLLDTASWLDDSKAEKDVVKAILSVAMLDGWQIGLRKVFLRAGQMATLENLRTACLNNAAIVLQKYVRRFLAQSGYRRQQKAVRKIQCLVRGGLARKLAHTLRLSKGALTVQTYVRRWIARRSYLKTRSAALVIQSCTRGMFDRTRVTKLRYENSAIILQKYMRRHLCNKHLRVKRRAAVVFQCVWRCKMAKREMYRRKAAAKETGALLTAKASLEQKVKDFEWRIELDKRLQHDAEKQHLIEIEHLTASFEKAQTEAASMRDALQQEETARKKAEKHLSKQNQEQEKALSRKDSVDLTAATEKVVIAEEKAKAASARRLVEVELAQQEVALAMEKLLTAETRSRELEVQLESLTAQFGDLQIEIRRLEVENASLQAVAGSSMAATRQRATVDSTNKGAEKPLYDRVMNNDAPRQNGVLSTKEADLDKEQAELDAKKQRLILEKQQGEQDKMLSCITEEIGFVDSKPVAATIIFRALLHWRSFEAERTNIFDRIIQAMSRAIENHTEDQHNLAYWLSNTTYLLFLLNRTLRTSAATSAVGQRRRPTVSLFDRWRAGGNIFSNRTSNGAAAGAAALPPALNPVGPAVTGNSYNQVEAKYPALLFKQQLTAFVEKIYGMVRDNVKREITTELGQCIQAPRAARGSHSTSSTPKGTRHGPTNTPLSQHWGTILASLDSLLSTLRMNHIKSFLIRKLFTQVFSFINVQLFNSLLLRRECCSFSNGEYVKMGLAELENWLHMAGADSVDSDSVAWDELKYIRQAVTFLVIHQKSKKTLDEINNDLCPVLSVQQLYRISTMYWDDKYGTETVSQEVLANMKQLMMDDTNSSASNSFLLDDDSSIPFSMDDITAALGESFKDHDLSTPALLQHQQIREFAGEFAFLGESAE
mmetsp:Transcript_16713/g.28212  ORF Transcript_16713/g.28212 Transcript_16713/m.28212 type:complete len:1568 (-) Transcript_16713:109-4812(-)